MRGDINYSPQNIFSCISKVTQRNTEKAQRAQRILTRLTKKKLCDLCGSLCNPLLFGSCLNENRFLFFQYPPKNIFMNYPISALRE